MHDGTSFGGFGLLPPDCGLTRLDSGEPETETESALRARSWIAEAALERESSHYVPITASWALSGQYLGAGVSLPI